MAPLPKKQENESHQTHRAFPSRVNSELTINSSSWLPGLRHPIVRPPSQLLPLPGSCFAPSSGPLLFLSPLPGELPAPIPRENFPDTLKPLPAPTSTPLIFRPALLSPETSHSSALYVVLICQHVNHPHEGELRGHFSALFCHIPSFELHLEHREPLNSFT